MEQVEVVIAGGGLSGLVLASQLEKRASQYLLLEARPRFGGRILALRYPTQSSHQYYDLGPAWFWPGQPKIAKLIGELGLQAFEQYAFGTSCFEDAEGRIHRGAQFASMQGSLRLKGSFQQLIAKLEERIPEQKRHLSTPILRVENQKSHLLIQTPTGTLQCQRLVFTLPPRVVAESISFTPPLNSDVISAMQSVPTWMAGHAKLIALYEKPIWREAGFSGDVISHRGPLGEIHDASPEQGGPYALFGFVATPAKTRQNQQESLIREAIAQLAGFFGNEMRTPLAVHLQDWAREPETATPRDQKTLRFHPHYGLPQKLANLWQQSLYFGSTEVAATFGGYLEGALEAVDQVLAKW